MSPLAATNSTPLNQPSIAVRSREAARAVVPVEVILPAATVDVDQSATQRMSHPTPKQLHPADLSFLCTVASCIRLRGT